MLHELRAASCESRVKRRGWRRRRGGDPRRGGGGAFGGDSALSVTALTGCVRQAFLKSTEPYYQRPDQQYWSYRGTLGHLLAERAGRRGAALRARAAAAERPAGHDHPVAGRDRPVARAADRLQDDGRPRQPSPLHVAQLNVYRWLVSPEYAIERLGIRGLMKGVQKAAVPLWPEGRPSGSSRSAAPWPRRTSAAPGRPDRGSLDVAFCPVAACERGQVSLAAS